MEESVSSCFGLPGIATLVVAKSVIPRTPRHPELNEGRCAALAQCLTALPMKDRGDSGFRRHQPNERALRFLAALGMTVWGCYRE
jgi:hypothetical protein